MKKNLFFLVLLILVLSIVSISQSSLTNGSNNKISALYIRISGTINPAQVDLLEDGYNDATRNNYDLIIIGLDTPGGLAKSMRDMVKIILNSRIPVVVWVGPKGAQAASAGVFLVAASDIAAMAPNTSIGAASPVAMGGKDTPKTLEKKIKNDLMSLIRSMAREKNRNFMWYERAIETAESLNAQEAAINKVIDIIAVSPTDLMEQIGKKGFMENGKLIKFDKNSYKIIEFSPSLRYKFLSWLLDPQIAYLLLLGGIAGLFFELSHPGVIFPGVFGSICLLLALYALSVLPTNVAGLLLILLGFVLFILEIKIISYGLLTIGGLVCMFLGSTILFRYEPGITGLSYSTILPSLFVIGILVIWVLYLVTKVQLKPTKLGIEGIVGMIGEVIEWKENKGKIKIRGEIWKAETTRGNTNLSKGTKVRVVDTLGLTLIIEPIQTLTT
ncbi:NfeD family protein [Desulfothermus sp.]